MALKKEIIRDLVFAACKAHDNGTGEGPDPREAASTYAQWLIDKGLTDCPKPSAARYVRWAVQDYGEAVVDETPSILGTVERRWSHDPEIDVYSFWPPGSRRPFAIAGDDVRAMKRQYSRPPMGEGLTVNMLCQSWGLAPDVFKFIKTELRWTHDQDEFTGEEHATRTSAELLRDREMRARGELHRAAAKAQHERVKSDAAKWRKFHDTILAEVRDSFAAPVRLGELSPPSASASRLAMLSPADLHIGKRDIYDEVADTYTAVIQTTREIAAMASEARAGRAVLVLGNDWGHIDTPGKTTTAGTPQDSASLRRVIRESVVTARDLVLEVVRWFAEVEILVVPSNHSKVGDLWMIEVIAAMFGDHDGITVSMCSDERHYFRFGVSLIGLEHGDGAKETDLGAIMARERPRDWGESMYRYWHIGHMHHLREKDVGGAVVCMAPSLSTTDRWHDKKGYLLSQQANVGYLYDEDAGQIARYVRNYVPADAPLQF